MGKKFSELERTSSLNNGDLFAVAQVDAQAQTGYKSKSTETSAVAQKLLKGIEFPTDLETDDKTVLGAINEVNSRTIINDVVSGPIANFKTSLERPIQSLEIDVNAVQAAGTPTPENPIPITGVSEITAYRTGKNLIDKESYEYLTNTNIIFGGTNTTISDSLILGPGTYTLSCSQITTGFYVDNHDGAVKRAYNTKSTTFSISSRQAVRINFYITGVTQSALLSYDYQLELGSTATPYEPYSGESIIVSLGGTYYGGHFTQDKTGHRQFEVTHNYIASYNGEAINEPWISSMDAYSQGATPTTGAQVVYPLVTPITIDLPDGQPIITLNGTNNIYADSGDCAVEYYMTIKDYIDKNIAAVQALVLNS